MISHPRPSTPLPTASPGSLPPTGPRQRKERAGRRPAGRVPVPGRGRENLDHLVRAFLLLFLEIECGRRPRKQLQPLMCPLLYSRLSQIWIRGGPPGRVLRVRGMRVSDDCYEALAVVVRYRRVGAVSLRLLHTVDGWRVADVGRPEDGPLPEPPCAFPADEPDAFEPAGGLALDGISGEGYS